MPPSPDTVLALLRLYAQALGLSLLFVGAGAVLDRVCLPRRPSPEPLGFRCARAFFLGLSAFLGLFVFFSRAAGSARVGLWASLALMGGICLWQAAAGAVPWRRALGLSVVLLLLVGFFSVTNATLWISWDPDRPSGTPGLMQHLGSIHSGRYANYALLIAEHDRIPRLPQNLGQSMLAAVHLLLGSDCPLAALMVWAPVCLAFLALLLFGFFRSQGFGVSPCLAAAFLVLYCNVAVSLVHVLVFDNGSPLAFAGYTDLIVSVATFLLLAAAVRDGWATGRLPWAALPLAGLLGATWSWYAPQNVVLAAFACGGAALASWRARRREGLRPLRPWLAGAAALAAGVTLGATQLGALLPRSLREDVDRPVFAMRPLVRVRPYTQHATSPWTGIRRNVELRRGRDHLSRPRPYETAWRQARRVGPDEVFRRVVWFAENNLWETLRMLGYPLCGLFLFWRSRQAESPESESDTAWLWLSGLTFLGGFAISYGLEVDGIKWWLARFLAPGCVMGITCLALVGLRRLRQGWRGAALCAVVLVAATWGPMAELAAVFQRNCLARNDPLGHRLDLMVRSKGPFR